MDRTGINAAESLTLQRAQCMCRLIVQQSMCRAHKFVIDIQSMAWTVYPKKSMNWYSTIKVL